MVAVFAVVSLVWRFVINTGVPTERSAAEFVH